MRAALSAALRPAWLATYAVAAALIATQILTPLLAAQESPAEDDEWDVTLARGETREIDFTTEEGTWMSMDISRDGRWVAFDLLGHVYRVPADGGGDAELLTGGTGVATHYHPRYSPDGSKIAFISDREGQNNLWVMDADGGNPRSVFTDLATRAVEPAWSADGDYIFVRLQDVAAGRGASGRGGIWMYHRDGGDGIEVLADQPQAQWPSPSEDGRYLYFHVYTGPPGLQGRDALAGHWQVRRKDLRTGEIVNITAGTAAQQVRASSGSAYAPEISPDGRHLAFARRIAGGTISYRGHTFGPRTALWIRDLETGSERVAMDPITVDNAEGIKTMRILPGYSWTADGSGIVVTQGGKIRQLDVATGDVTTVPFSARVQRTISERTSASFRIDDGPFDAKMLRWYAASPDASRIAFQAVGRIWLAPADGGAPSRLTSGDGPHEFSPSWSPDGNWIAYTTWDGGEGGHVWKIPAGGGAPQQLTTSPSEYAHPVWTLDGSEIVVTRGSGAAARARSATQNPYWELWRVPAEGGSQEKIMTIPAGGPGGLLGNRRQITRASFGPGGRIHFPAGHETEGGGGATALMSARMDGSDLRVHATIPFGDEFVVSPGGNRVAFQEGDNVFWAPLPPGGTGGDPIELKKKGAPVPVTQLTTDGRAVPALARRRPARIREWAALLHAQRRDWRDRHHDDPSQRRPRHSGGDARPDQRPRRHTGQPSGSRERDGADRRQQDHVCGRLRHLRGRSDHGHDRQDHRSRLRGHARPPLPRAQGTDPEARLRVGHLPRLWGDRQPRQLDVVTECVRQCGDDSGGAVVGPRTYSTGDPLYRGDAARQNELSSYEVAEQNINRLASWGANRAQAVPAAAP